MEEASCENLPVPFRGAPGISLPRRSPKFCACRARRRLPSLVATSVRVSTPYAPWRMRARVDESTLRRIEHDSGSRGDGVAATPAAAPPAAIVRITREGGATADTCTGSESRERILEVLPLSPSATCTRSSTALRHRKNSFAQIRRCFPVRIQRMCRHEPDLRARANPSRCHRSPGRRLRAAEIPRSRVRE